MTDDTIDDTTHTDATDSSTTTATTTPTLADPAALRDRSDVEFLEDERTFPSEQFRGLRERYDAIDGVVMVGVTTDDGEVLLQGDETWSPPGGDVEPGEDWYAAARRNIRELTGVEIAVERPERVEMTAFCLEPDPDTRFTAASLHVRASLAEEAPAFRADPTVMDDPDHAYYDDADEVDLGWFGEVPPDAHPNHEDHVALYLD